MALSWAGTIQPPIRCPLVSVTRSLWLAACRVCWRCKLMAQWFRGEIGRGMFGKGIIHGMVCSPFHCRIFPCRSFGCLRARPRFHPCCGCGLPRCSEILISQGNTFCTSCRFRRDRDRCGRFWEGVGGPGWVRFRGRRLQDHPIPGRGAAALAQSGLEATQVVAACDRF